MCFLLQDTRVTNSKKLGKSGKIENWRIENFGKLKNMFLLMGSRF